LHQPKEELALGFRSSAVQPPPFKAPAYPDGRPARRADARDLLQTGAYAPAPAAYRAARAAAAPVSAPAAAPAETVSSTSVRAARAATPAATPAPAAPAPAPPANGCLMGFLQNHGEYSTLLRLIYASNSNISRAPPPPRRRHARVERLPWHAMHL